jgi:hypothetical protein
MSTGKGSPSAAQSNKEPAEAGNTEAQKQKDTPETTADQKAANEKARSAACETAKSNLATMKTYGRIRVKDEKTGEFRFLTPEEKSQKELETEKFIQETCK